MIDCGNKPQGFFELTQFGHGGVDTKGRRPAGKEAASPRGR